MSGGQQTKSSGVYGRVLCITSNFPRWKGDSTTPFVLHLAQDLQELGWRVDVLAPHAPGTASQELLDGIHVERFRYLWPTDLETVCYQGGALINLRKSKTNIFKLPTLVLAEWLSVIRRLALQKYDLLHSHWILPQGFTGALAAMPLRVPHVLTVHGGDVFALKGKWLSYFKRFALYGADAVTANSSVTYQAVTDIAPKLPILQRIPMGVSIEPCKDDDQIMQLRARYRRSNGPLLIFAGRIVGEKGIEDLIRAVGILQPRLPNVTALIIGEGQDRANLEQLTRQMSLENRITFTGWVEPRAVPAYLAAADIFIGPSRRAQDGWIEAQGLTFLEAMVAKTPVIATRVGGIVDSVHHEQTGLLVNERSPAEIAAAVERFSNEPLLANKLCDQGYRLAVNEFSRLSTAQAFSELFQRIMKKISIGL